MGTLFVVIVDPWVDIVLKPLDALIDLSSKRGRVKLILHGLMKPLTNAVGLRGASLGFRMLNVLNVQIQLVVMMLTASAVFAASVGQNAQ